MKLSIILPVYNTGHLVEKAINSLLNLKSIDLEILCMNDGSTDNSWEKLQEIEKKYHQVKLINKQNEGLSMTRNKGIQASSGDYVYFLDSDDWINTEAFDELLTYCHEGYDIIHGNFSYVYEDRTIKANKAQLEGIYTGQEFLCQGLLQDKISMASCINIFKRDFLMKHDLLFLPGIYHEDEEFNLRVFSYAGRVISKDLTFHMYLQRSNSISNDKSKEDKRFNDVIVIYESIMRFLNESTHISKAYEQMCTTYVSFIILLSYAKQNNKETMKISEQTIKQLKLHRTIHSNLLIYKISKLALWITPITYIKLLRVYFKKRSKKL